MHTKLSKCSSFFSVCLSTTGGRHLWFVVIHTRTSRGFFFSNVGLVEKSTISGQKESRRKGFLSSGSLLRSLRHKVLAIHIYLHIYIYITSNFTNYSALLIFHLFFSIISFFLSFFSFVSRVFMLRGSNSEPGTRDCCPSKVSH